jgi:hypothetical protein
MPIEFACGCGKSLKVADEHAGKRTKCPACANPIVVPSPSVAEVSAEDEAFRALNDESEPVAPSNHRSWHQAEEYARPPSRGPAPPPAKPDAGSYAARALARAGDEVKKPSSEKPKKKSWPVDPYAPREQKWHVDWGKVIGGIVGVLIGGALLFGGLAAGRFFIWSPIILIGGIIAIIGGFLSRSER